MIIKTFVFVLFSVTAVQVHADDDLDFSVNEVRQTCTKEDLLHAQGKSPCIVKLKTSQALFEEMGKQFAAYYNQLRLHQNITGNLLKTLQQNHTEYNKRTVNLLKEYREDITQLQQTYSSVKRKALCKRFLQSIEEKHQELDTLGASIKAQVAAAKHRSLQPRSPSEPNTWYGKIWEWLKKAWGTIEKPLLAVIGINLFCTIVYKIGKGMYTLGKRAFLWGRNALDNLATQKADIAELTSTTEELIGEGESAAETQQLLNNLAEVIEPNAELTAVADNAVVTEATSVMEAFEAREAAMQAIGTSRAGSLLEIARTAEVARVTNAAEAIEATQASEIADVVQIARIAEAAEGIGEAAVEGAVEGAAEGAAEVAVEGAVEGAAVEGAEVVGEVAAEEILTGVGETIALEAAEGTAVAAAGTAAAPIAIAAVGAVAVGAAVSGIAYIVDPEGTKRFYRNLWNSIRHLFGYY